MAETVTPLSVTEVNLSVLSERKKSSLLLPLILFSFPKPLSANKDSTRAKSELHFYQGTPTEILASL